MNDISDLTNAANMAGQPPNARPVPRPSAHGNPIPAPAPTIPRPTPNPVPVSTSQPVQSTSASEPVRMSQGTDYNAGGSSGNTTIPIDLDEDNGNRPKLNIKVVGIGVAIGLVFIFLISILGKLGGSDKPQETPPPIDNTIAEPIIIEPTNYSAEEVVQLRACGYSTEEMENAFMCGISCSDMVAQAEAERQAWIDEAVAPYYDTTSDVYKEDMAQTWRGLTKYEDTSKYIGASQFLTKTRNLDFEKVDTHGAQLFIKIYLQDEPCSEYFFHLCTIEDWLRLPDKGNIICTYDYTTAYYDDGNGNYIEDYDRIFITNSTIEIFD